MILKSCWVHLARRRDDNVLFLLDHGKVTRPYKSHLPMGNRVLRFRVVSISFSTCGASFSNTECFVFDLGSFVFDLLGVSYLVPRFQYYPFSCD